MDTTRSTSEQRGPSPFLGGWRKFVPDMAQDSYRPGNYPTVAAPKVLA